MNVFDYIIGGLLLLMAVFLVVAIMLQSGKGKGLSGTITGGAFLFRQKQRQNA